MKKIKKILILMLSFGSVLVSCGGNDNPGETPDNSNENEPDTYVPTLITPTGAPTLPAYKLLLSDKVKTESPSDNTAIPGYLSSGNADLVIFDSTNAQKVLNKAGENAKFEFEQMLTGGNFHLLGFGKSEDEVPTNDDYILGFMSQSTPGILFRNIYGNDMVFDQAFNAVNQVQQTLLTMNSEYKLSSGQKIDWAVIAEPANTALQGKLKQNGVQNILDINLNTAFKEKNSEKWNKDYICQAGIFVNKEFKEKHPKVYESTMDLLNDGVNALFTNLDGAYSEMTSGEYSDVSKFTAKFGFSSAVIKNVQGENSAKNGFGVVPTNVKFTVEDINTFNQLTAESSAK